MKTLGADPHPFRGNPAELERHHGAVPTHEFLVASFYAPPAAAATASAIAHRRIQAAIRARMRRKLLTGDFP